MESNYKNRAGGGGRWLCRKFGIHVEGIDRQVEKTAK